MKLVISLLTLLIIGRASLFAQNQIITSDTGKNGLIKFQRFDTSQVPLKATMDVSLLRSILKMDSQDSLKVVRVIVDKNVTHKIYQQYYKGYKVSGGTYATHSNNGRIETINGHFQKVKISNLKIVIDEKSALKKVIAWIGAKKYGWEDSTTEKLYREQMADSTASLKPRAESLIIFDDSITHSFRLAYKFPIYAIVPLVVKNVYIDAVSGNIIGAENLIHDANTTGTASTLYSGTQSITIDSYSSPNKYRLRETRTTNGKTVQIQTLNMQNTGNYATAVDFSNSTNNWSTSAAELDVHWGTEKVFDYWATVRNRNSFDNNGGTLKGYVHADLHAINPQFSNNDNAFWDGAMHTMTYGDGSNSFNSVTSLDVIAHEIAHGICQYTAKLNSGNTTQQNEQSALNEGLSDIWAAVIENWAAPNKQPWKMGEDIMKNGFPYIRSLDNPKTIGYPDTYNGTYWDNGNEPHRNSTIISHWFYLLSQGGNGTNDLGNHYSVTGIGIDAAAKIVWNAESTGKLLSQSQYTDARTAMISAAIEMFGPNSNEVIQTTRAWYAVGLGNDFDFSAVCSILGPNQICSNATFNIKNLPPDASVQWKNNGVTYNGNQYLLTVTPNDYSVNTLIATITIGANSFTIQKTPIVINNPFLVIGVESSSNGLGGGSTLCNHAADIDDYANTISVTLSDAPPLSIPLVLHYELYDMSSNRVYQNTVSDFALKYLQESILPLPPSLTAGVYNIELWTVDGNCNVTTEVFEGILEYQDCNSPLMINAYPNPATNYINVAITDLQNQKIITTQKNTVNEIAAKEVSFDLYDLMRGTLVRHWKESSQIKIHKLNSSGIAPGQYILVTTKGKNKKSIHIAIK